jgi:hypothetical protein
MFVVNKALKRYVKGCCNTSSYCDKFITEATGINSSQTAGVTTTTTTTTTVPWTTGGDNPTILKYKGSLIQALGFSLTTTQYISGVEPDFTYYNFSTKTTTSNVDKLANVVKGIVTNYDKNILRAPMIRIPLCADYWLWGSGNNCIQIFTGDEYKNAIISIMNRCWDLIGNNLCSFVIDLHWNYAGGYGSTQSSFHNGSNQEQGYYFPSDQQSMPLASNTLDFWSSICDYFGIDSNGKSLTTNGPTNELIKQNTFFELYNEPYIDTQIPDDYETYYYNYINGYSAPATGISLNDGTAKNGTYYYYTGMGQMYCQIRTVKKAYNILNISGNAGYAYMDTWKFYDYNTNKIKTDSYNCFTELFYKISNGEVIDPNGNKYASSSEDLHGITLGFHPYSEHSGSYKTPGYNYYYTSTNTQHTTEMAPRFGDILLALSTPNTKFSCLYPFLITEFGQYEAPWGDFANNTNPVATDFALTNNGSIIGYYPGGYYNKEGEFIYAPGNIGTIYDCNTYNASYLIWAIRPNMGYYDGSPDSNNANNSWSAYSPDTFTGSETTKAANSFNLISTANSNLTGNNGSDFDYIFRNYMANSWY